MAWLPNTGISCLSPCLLLFFVIHTHAHTHLYLAENGVLSTPCHVSGFLFVKIYSCVKWKDAITMECFTLSCTASLWLQYSLTILLLGIGCNEILKTKLRCGHPSLFHFSTHTYVFVGSSIVAELTLMSNRMQSRQGQFGGAALYNDLERKRAPLGCSIQLFPVLETLRRKQHRFCLISEVGGFIFGLQSLVFTPDCKPRLSMLIFWKLHLMEGAYLFDTW